MINRPYINYSTEDVCRCYEANKKDIAILKLVQYELNCRRKKRARARATAALVDAAIRELEEASSLPIAITAASLPVNTTFQISPPGITLFPWQKRALVKWREKGYIGVVEAVTGAGKTHVALGAMMEHLASGWKVVIVVPSVALQEQWYKKVDDLLNQSCKSAFHISLMGGNHASSGEFDVLIAVAASASQYLLLSNGSNGLIIADECHRYGSQTWSKVLEKGFERRLGLTATYDREDSGIEDFLDPYFRGVCYSLSYDEALSEDVIARFKIAFIGVEFNPHEMEAYEEADVICRKLRGTLIHSYKVAAEPFGLFMKQVAVLSNGGNSDKEVAKLSRRYMNFFNKRRQVIANATQKLECLKGLIPSIQAAERTIIFSQTKDAAEQAVRTLTNAKLNARVLDATMSMKERKSVFADFESGIEDVVAAPMLLDEGVDVPSADLAIILAASRSSRQMIQRMGRVLRKKADGRLARIAIIYVSGTVEDPDMGAHEAFIEAIRDATDYEETFGAEDSEEICQYLNDWDA